MAKETKKMKELKALAEELYEILTPEDSETGEEMELDEFMLNGKKKLTEKVLESNLIEFCNALEEEDEDAVSEDIIKFMKANDVEFPWDEGESEEEDDDDEPDDDDEEEPDDEDEDEDDDVDEEEDDEKEEDDDDDDVDEEEDEDEEDESPDFDKMSVPELKAFAKENKIKGIAGLKKKALVKLIKDAVDADEPDDDFDDEEPEEDEGLPELTWDDLKDMKKKALIKVTKDYSLISEVDDYDTLDEFREDIAAELNIEVGDTGPDYESMSIVELKKAAKEAGYKVKDIKGKNKEKLIAMLENGADEPDEDEDEEKELTLKEQLDETTKLADLKDMVDNYDEFKKIRKKAKKISGLHGPRELKPLMYKALGEEPPAKQKRKAGTKKKKEPVYKRADSVIDAIKKLGKKGFEMQELIDESDKIYVKKTGGSSSKNFYNTPNNICHGLVAFEILEKDGNKYKLN